MPPKKNSWTCVNIGELRRERARKTSDGHVQKEKGPPARENDAASVEVLQIGIPLARSHRRAWADGDREIESESNWRTHPEEQRRTVMIMLGEPA